VLNTTLALLRHFDGRDKKQLVLLLLVTTVNGLIQALGVVSVMPLIAVLTEPSLAERNPYLIAFTQMLPFSWQGSLLLVLGIAVFLILLAGNSLVTFEYWLTLKFFNEKEHSLSVKLLNNYLEREYTEFTNGNVSEMARNVISEVDRVMVGTMLALVKLISDSMISLSILLVLLFVNLSVTLTVILALLSAYVAVYLLITRKIRFLGDQFPGLEKAVYSAVKQALEFYKEIRVTGGAELFIRKYSEPAKEMTLNATNFYLLRALPALFIELTAFGLVIFVAIYISNTTGSSAEAIATLAFFAFAVYRLVPVIKEIFEGVEELKFLGRTLQSLLGQFNTDITEKVPLTHSRERMSIYSGISISDLCFKYKLKPNRLFNKLTIHIPALKFTCIVGPSGAGKSTLLDLLLGLLTPDSGEISVDETLLTHSNIDLWRNSIGYVPQYVQLLEGSVLENIGFGIPVEEIDRERVFEVARIAGIDAFIEKDLINTYETVIGDGGVRLSGGQKQRIGIARSLYHKPSVLFFDEATNELDSETENTVLKNILDIGDFTIVFVSHRQSIRERADSVVALTSQDSEASGPM
jgi:ATP-binding cassette, subfamily B, bacterial PglK